MLENQSGGYEKMMDDMKKNLRTKVVSIYVIDEEKKTELRDLINSIHDYVELIDFEKRINEILSQMGDLTKNLLRQADKSVLNKLEMIIQKDLIDNIRQKADQERQLDLCDLEAQLDEALMYV